jgi:S1-C subfamily serine protease
VKAVSPGTPAAAVLKPGDTLVAVDGRGGDFETLRSASAPTRARRIPPRMGAAPRRPRA